MTPMTIQAVVDMRVGLLKVAILWGSQPILDGDAAKNAATDGSAQRGGSSARARYGSASPWPGAKKDPKPKLGVFRQTAFRGVRGEPPD